MNTNTDYIEERITSLEMKFAYLEDFLLKVQTAAVEQREELDIVKAENLLMREKIKELSDLLEGDIPNVRPPHY